MKSQATVPDYTHVGARSVVSLLLLALLILLLAFGLRLWNLDTQSIWHDEAWSIRAIRDPINTPDDNTPFVYYVLMRPLWMAAGESAFALRYGSVLIGLMVVAMTIRLGWRWYGAGVGLAAGALAAIMPLLWAYSQEVRAYILMPLLALVLLEGAGKLVRAEKRSRAWLSWIGVAIVELIALYTHNLAVPLLAWLNVTVMVIWLLRREWRQLAIWVGVQALIGLLYIPWLLTQTPSGTPLNTPPALNLALLRDIWYSYFLPVLLQLRDTGDVLLLDVLGAALVVILAAIIVATIKGATRGGSGAEGQWGEMIGTRYIVSLPPTRNWLLISHVLLVPLFTTLLLMAAHIDFHPRYYIASVPGTMILLVVGIEKIGAAFEMRSAKVFVVGYWLLVVGAVAWVSANSLQAIANSRAYQHDDFAGLAAYYATLPDETVILLPFGTEPALQTYFAERLDIKARFVNLPLYSDEPIVIQTINELVYEGAQQLEFLTWYQLPADERGMYPCLLSAASSEVSEPRAFFGLMTQGYTLMQQVTMQSLDAEPRYADLQLDDAAYAASPAGSCVRTQWSGSAREGLSVAASLLNLLDAEIARGDAAVAPADPASSDLGAAYNLLHLPNGAPPLDYGVSWTVYSPAQPTGYDVLSAEGNPAGKIYTLREAITAHGSPYSGEPFTAPVLQGDNAGDDCAINSGTPLDITLLLPGRAGEIGVLALAGDDWRLEQPLEYGAQPMLSWQRMVVPPGNGGEAVLSLDGDELTRYTILDPTRTFEPPVVDIALDVDFPGLGRLVGVNVGDVIPGQPFEVTLIWGAEVTSETAYTVFVQLIGEDGQVIAQSDAMPAGNTRPTTGWLPGEFVTDTHTLNVPQFTGNTRLIAGLYDAGQPGFPRVVTRDGADFVAIPLVEEGG